MTLAESVTPQKRAADSNEPALTAKRPHLDDVIEFPVEIDDETLSQIDIDELDGNGDRAVPDSGCRERRHIGNGPQRRAAPNCTNNCEQ